MRRTVPPEKLSITPRAHNSRVARLHVHLQSGFDNDAVIVRVNGRECLRAAAVSTRRNIGLATRESFEVDEGPLEIDIESHGLTKHLHCDIHDTLYLGVSIANGELRTIVSETPFGYG